MSLLDSPLAPSQLRQHPKRLERLLGLSVEAFDALFENVYTAELSRQKTQHPLWTPQRVERMVARYRPTLKSYLCITLLYLRTILEKKCHSRKFQLIITYSLMILDLSSATNGLVHDFGLFKRRALPPALQELLFMMGKVIIGADSAYEAIGKLYPSWQARVQQKARRNHPLSEKQKLDNTVKSKVRILIEHCDPPA